MRLPPMTVVRSMSLLTLILAISVQPAALALEQRAALVNGVSFRGRISGENPEKLGFLTADRQSLLPLRLIQQIAFDSRPTFLESAGPMQRLALHNGDRIHGEIVEGDEALLTAILRGGRRISLPAGVLTSAAQPPGERILLYADFESDSAVFQGLPIDSSRFHSGKSSGQIGPQPRRTGFALPESLPSGRIELAFFDNGIDLPGEEWSIEAVFRASDDRQTLKITLGWGEQQYRFQSTQGLQFTVQPLPRRSGWRQLTIVFDESRCLAAIDQYPLAVGPGLRIPFRELVVENRAVPDPATLPIATPPRHITKTLPDLRGVAAIDDLKVWQPAEQPHRPKPIPGQDSLWLTDGEELFGTVVRLNARGATLAAAFGTRSFPCTQIRELSFRQARVSERPVAGWLARLELVPGLWGPVGPPDQLNAAIQSVGVRELIVDHADLGLVRFSPEEIQRIIPEFLGTRWTIAPGLHHLGDEVREEFDAPIPAGTTLRCDWTWAAVPPGPLYVSLNASDLEPAGPQTAPDSRFLREMAAGGLVTVLFVNDQSLGAINRQINLRSLPGRRQRVRIPASTAMFKSGRNSIRLEQHPARDDAGQFDDFEFSNLAIESEPRAAP